jgi:hypothetical protein
MKTLCITASLLLAGLNTAFAQLSETDKIKTSLTIDNADTVAWLRSGVVQLGFNEGFLHNWAAGGEVVSLAVDGLLSGNITRLYHKQVWSNSIDASYSLFYAYSNHFVPRKVDDRLDITSKYGVRIDGKKHYYFTGLFNFKSQFTRGYDYSVPDWQTFSTSNFMSPGYFTLASGIEFRSGSDLSVFFSPIALRLTVADKKYTNRLPEGAFGVANGKQSRLELGAYFTARYAHDLSHIVRYKTRLDLYSNYLAKDKKDSLGNVVKRDNPGNIDVFWDNLITVRLGKYFNLNLSLTAIYDNDIPYDKDYIDTASGTVRKKDEPGTDLGWWQVKEVMSFGFAYKFH